MTVTMFSQKEISQLTNSFSAESKIAEGGQAEIFKGVWNNADVIVKRFSVSSHQGLHALITELDIMKK